LPVVTRLFVLCHCLILFPFLVGEPLTLTLPDVEMNIKRCYPRQSSGRFTNTLHLHFHHQRLDG
jgi:hypothetical protein